MSLLKYATPPVLPGSASNRVHPVALALNPKAIFLTPPFLPASAQSVCQSVGSAFQNVESSLLWLAQLPWFTPPSSFPWGTMVVPDPSCLLEFAEQLERSFNRISLLHGILFKVSRLCSVRSCAFWPLLTSPSHSQSPFCSLTSLTCWLIQN